MPILLLIGILSVNPESGITLALYLFYSVKLIENIFAKKIPAPSLPQLFLILGTIILIILHSVFLKNSFLNEQALNWLILITSPFYLIKSKHGIKYTYRFILVGVLLYLSYNYIIGTPKIDYIHMGLSNPNIVAILVLYIGFLVRAKDFYTQIFDLIIILGILFLLDSKGGVIIFITINFICILRQKKSALLLLICIALSTLSTLLLFKPHDIAKIKDHRSYTGRIASYSFFGDYFIKNTNQLFGNGFGKVALIADNSVVGKNYPNTNIQKFNHVHNEIIESLIEGGILWLVILIVSFFYFFYRNFKIKDDIQLKIIFLFIFILTIQFYASYRNGIIFSLVPLFCLSYRFSAESYLKSNLLNNAIFIFYLILIPTLGAKALSKHIAYENLRSIDLNQINQSIRLSNNEPYFYYEKLKLLRKLHKKNYNALYSIGENEEIINFDTEFYSTKNILDSIHPNYKSAEIIYSLYEFQKGNITKSYNIIKESNIYTYDFLFHYLLIYYASYMDEYLLLEEIENMLIKAVLLKNEKEPDTINYEIDSFKFIILYNSEEKKNIDLIKLKKAILKNRNFGFEPLKEWLNEINKECFSLELK